MKTKLKRSILFLLTLLVLSTILHSQEDKLSKLYPYPEFKRAFTQKLLEMGVVPTQTAFHLVVLVNTTDTEGPVSHWMRNIYYGLVSDFMSEGDYLSLVPYQLKVRHDYAFWDRAFNKEDINVLYPDYS